MNRMKRWMMNTKIGKELGSLIVWGAIGWAIAELVIWLAIWSRAEVQTFAGGVFICFLGLTVLGGWRQSQQLRMNQQAHLQFEKDMKADQEQQAEIDRTIIDKLRKEHKLSGTEQDRRLKALETALKHLRKR